MAEVEKLIVELDAKVDNYIDGMKKSEKQASKTANKTEDLSKKLKQLSLAATVAGAAVLAMARQAAEYAKELTIAATRSGENVERMQELAFAANTVGISLEKLGDIGKDVREKIAEFLATGSGGFQDFADVMQITGIEATELAMKLQTMTSSEVLQELVSQMENAGVSATQMSFALEGLASDTTDLIPLFTDSGSKLKDLTDDFIDLGVQVDEYDIKKMTEISSSFSKLGSTVSSAGVKLSSEFAQPIIAIITLLTTMAAVATNTILVISQGFKNIGEVVAASLHDAIEGTDFLPEAIEKLAIESRKRLNEVFGKSLLKFLIGEPDDVKEDLGKVESLTVEGGKQITQSQLDEDRQKLDNKRKFNQAAGVLSAAFLEDNKAINAGIIIADTALGIQRSLVPLVPGGPANFAQAALIAAQGVVNLSNALSATKGGGSISGGGGSAPSTDIPQNNFNNEPDIAALDISQQTINEGGLGGGFSNIRVVFEAGDGDQLLEALAEGLNQRSINS